MTFIAWLTLQFLAGIWIMMLTGGWMPELLTAAWSACLWYGMIYYNGVLAEWAMNKAGETN